LLIGGHALALACFSGAFFWFVLVRFNYTGHGKGENKHVDGIDFDRSNLLSIKPDPVCCPANGIIIIIFPRKCAGWISSLPA
jgi:hypothetical protein